MERILTRQLSQPELIERIIAVPYIQSLHLDFTHPSQESVRGLTSITDTDREKIEVIYRQNGEDWGRGILPKNASINIWKQQNVGYRSGFIKGLTRQGYELIRGNLIFAEGGNTSNPDALHWYDSFARIKGNKIELELGEEIEENHCNELKLWLKNYQ